MPCEKICERAHAVARKIAELQRDPTTTQQLLDNYKSHLEAWLGKTASAETTTTTALESYIDHTLLKANATETEVANLCREARENRFFAVCVNASRVELAVRELQGTNVRVAAVAGFPLGATTTEVKSFEAKQIVSQGALEVDMVLNVGKFLDGDYDYVYNDVKQVVQAVASTNPAAIVKVILETCLLPQEDQVIDACLLCLFAGAHYVKTSTGFSTSGAELNTVRLMKTVVNDMALVKASGGIRTTEAALEFIKAGASRLGTSSGVAIIKGLSNKTTSSVAAGPY